MIRDFPWIIIAICATLLASLLLFGHNPQKECIKSGGRWVKTGTTASAASIGKAVVPMSIDNYACKEVSK